MLDYGTGSGVLAIAALVMGAEHALGIDCEAEATELCEATADLNGLADRFEVSQCSNNVSEVRLWPPFSIQNAFLLFQNLGSKAFPHVH